VSALNDAGADVVTVTLGDAVTNVSNEQRDQIQSIAGSAPPTAQGGGKTPVQPTDQSSQDQGNGNAVVFDALAAILTSGTGKSATNEAELEKMETLGMVNVDGNLDAGGNLIVVVGGQSSAPTDSSDPDPALVLDIPLIQRIEAASHNKVSVVGCESSTTGTSYISDYQNAGIATVDCVDLPIGKIALPFALRGGVDKGDYGIKGTAQRILPVSIAGNGTT
jgi:hypothetical protein